MKTPQENKKRRDGHPRPPERPLDAIARHCLECSGGDADEVAGCTDEKCNLHPYRFGPPAEK